MCNTDIPLRQIYNRINFLYEADHRFLAPLLYCSSQRPVMAILKKVTPQLDIFWQSFIVF